MFRSLHKVLFANMVVQGVLLALFLCVFLAMSTPLRTYMFEPARNPCEPVPSFDCGGVAVKQDLRPFVWWTIVLPASAMSAVYEPLRTGRPLETDATGLLVVGYVEFILMMLAFVYLLLFVVSGTGKLIRRALRAKSQGLPPALK